MANFALNYSFSRNLNIPLDEDAVKGLLSEVVEYVQTKGKCYEGQLFSVTGDTTTNNGLYITLSKGPEGQVVKLATQDALDAVSASAGKIDKIQLNGNDLQINDKVVNIDLSTYSTVEYVDNAITGLSEVYATKSELSASEDNAKTYTDGEIEKLSDVYAPKSSVDTLVGEDTEKSVRTIASEEVAKIVAGADASYDTLKEIADWIQNDTTGAAAMANDIDALQEINADERLDALEAISGESHTHSNKALLDTYTQTEVNLADAVAKKHEHSNKEVLDSISADKVTAWDAAEQNAKDYADGLAVNYDAAGAAASALTDAKAWVESKNYLTEHQDISSLATKIEVTDAEGRASAYTDTEIEKLSNVYESKGAAASALTDAKTYADGLAVNYDAAGAAASALTDAKTYADGLAVNYDAAGAAVSALTDAKTYADGLNTVISNRVTSLEAISGQSHTHDNKEVLDGISALMVADWNDAVSKEHVHDNKEVLDGISTEKVTAWDAAEQNAKDYADGLAVNYDAAGAAVSASTEALNSAISYVDGKLVDYATKSYVTDTVVGQLSGGTITIEGYAKTTEVKEMDQNVLASAKTYTDTVIENLNLDEAYASKTVVDTLVGEDAEKSVRTIASEEVAKIVADADEDFDTLKEIADWIKNDSTGAAALGNTVAALTEDVAELSAVSHTHANKEVLDGISADKVTAWDAAEQNAKDYADNLVENIKPYSGGIATKIENYVIDVNVAESTEEKTNFMEVNESNELQVTGITLDAAKTSKDIVVEGGEWADSVKPIFGGTVPAGTTWESFLERMLCVEKFVSSVNTSTSFNVSCGNIDPKIDKSGIVETGTKVTLGETTANATTASQSLTVKTFTYGYKLGEDGVYNSATAYTETLTPSLTTSNDALKITFSNFADAVNDGSVIATKTGNSTIESVEMYAMEGSNSVTVAQTGDTYAASTAVTAGTIYIASNLKKYFKSDGVTLNTYEPAFASATKTASDITTYTVTGSSKYFIGDVMDYAADYWDADRSDVVRGLTTTGWTTANTITNAHTFKTGTKQQTVVVPAKYTSVAGKDVNNGDVKFNLMKTFDFTNSQGYVSSYKVFVAPATDGLGADSKITITIK